MADQETLDTTSTEPMETAPAAPAEAEATPEPETPPATEPAAAEKPQWDKERQALDQERANFRKEMDAKKAELEAKMAELKAISASPQSQTSAPATDTDPFAEVEKTLDEGISEFDTAKIGQANKRVIAEIRAEREARRKLEAELQQTRRENGFWLDFTAKNPDVPLSEARKLLDKHIEEANKDGYGPVLQLEVTRRFNASIDELKKKPKPSSPAAPTTAAPARGNAPARGVIPATTGARPEATQERDVMAKLAKQLFRQR